MGKGEAKKVLSRFFVLTILAEVEYKNCEALYMKRHMFSVV